MNDVIMYGIKFTLAMNIRVPFLIEESFMKFLFTTLGLCLSLMLASNALALDLVAENGKTINVPSRPSEPNLLRNLQIDGKTNNMPQNEECDDRPCSTDSDCCSSFFDTWKCVHYGDGLYCRKQ
ncbi:MAG: hypothetical protein R3E08_03560 [Thiotrichaceae bacterium]